jgi:hypothetical protein
MRNSGSLGVRPEDGYEYYVSYNDSSADDWGFSFNYDEVADVMKAFKLLNVADDADLFVSEMDELDTINPFNFVEYMKGRHET